MPHIIIDSQSPYNLSESLISLGLDRKLDGTTQSQYPDAYSKKKVAPGKARAVHSIFDRDPWRWGVVTANNFCDLTLAYQN